MQKFLVNKKKLAEWDLEKFASQIPQVTCFSFGPRPRGTSLGFQHTLQSSNPCTERTFAEQLFQIFPSVRLAVKHEVSLCNTDISSSSVE